MKNSHKTDDQKIEHTSDLGTKGGNPQDDGVTSDSKEELGKLKEELTAMTETAKRTMADMQNMKRRQDEEKSTIIFMANAALIKALLPQIHNLNRAKQHVPEGAEEWAKGIEMSVDQINKTLQDMGLTPIETVDTPFNPDLHEALMSETGEKDMVIEELEKGYMLGNKVLTHAKVKVGNGE